MHVTHKCPRIDFQRALDLRGEVRCRRNHQIDICARNMSQQSSVIASEQTHCINNGDGDFNFEELVRVRRVRAIERAGEGDVGTKVAILRPRLAKHWLEVARVYQGHVHGVQARRHIERLRDVKLNVQRRIEREHHRVHCQT